MLKDICYDTKNIPLVERESFSNAILMLTKVKSEHYYIIGFSALKGYIEVGFDIESSLHEKISESMLIIFNNSNGNIVFESELCNVSRNIKSDNFNCEHIFFKGRRVIYRRELSTDCLLPTGQEELAENIIAAKNEIKSFLQAYYKNLLS